ncbi:DUF7088 domain-containing protein [Sphingobacterium suaedae]
MQRTSQITNRDVHITLFLDGDLPSGFNRLKQAALDMTNDFRSYAPDRLSFTLIDPLVREMNNRPSRKPLWNVAYFRPTCALKLRKALLKS